MTARRTPLFSRVLEETLESYVNRLIGGHIEIWELPYPLNDLGWVIHFRATEGVIELRQRLEQASADADRYYGIAFGSPIAIPRRTLAELEQIRGNPTRANQLEAASRTRDRDLRAAFPAA